MVPVISKDKSMRINLNAKSSRRVTVACALSMVFPALSIAQRPQEVIPTNLPPPPVYVNPRAGADDPRIGLKPGMHDAGEAALNMKLVTTISKPAVFDPPPLTPVPGETNSRNVGNGLTYANSDLAMGGTHLFIGNFYGISIYDIADPARIKLTTAIVCPGGQGDVSVYGHLLFMSVEGGGRKDCGKEPFPTPAAPAPGIAGAAPAAGGRAGRGARPPEVAQPDRIRGIRIFDITDISNPKQVADVQTCRGSHTHTLVVDPKDKDNIYVYISGSAAVRPAEELAGCVGGQPGDDPNTALFTIVVIKVPLAHPDQAKVVNSPRIFADPATGKADGLYVSGAHFAADATPRATSGCHDITVYSAIGLAAGACSGNGIILDIKDPVHPKRVVAESDPNYSFWHSATFSNDGSKVLFTDEWGGGTQPRCRATDPMQWGADTIYSISKDHTKLTLDSYYKMPAPQTEEENCVAHNGSLVPVPGRDIMVQGWYQGGVSIMDFTDGTHPFEMAFFDRGPTDAVQHIIGGDWAAYWYNGYIYSSEIARGVDVFKLEPSKYLTQNEIDAANQLHWAENNPQNQQKIVWPATILTAKAYVDQLARSNAMAPDKVTALTAAMDKKNSKEMKATAVALHKQAATLTGADAERMHELAGILEKQ
jgi:hypothetical protein